MAALGGCGMTGERIAHAGGTIHQLAAAIGAAIVQHLGTRRAEGAFEGADERARFVGGQVGAAALFGRRTRLIRRKSQPSLG
jgi:hypothetical protein